MKRWVDLDELRRDIAAQAKGIAMAAGLESVRVYVRIAEPDKRVVRVIEIDVVGQESPGPMAIARRIRR